MSRKTTEKRRPSQRLYNLREAAIYLGRSVKGVRELIWSGQLPVVCSGKKQYVDVADMDQFIEENKSYAVDKTCLS